MSCLYNKEAERIPVISKPILKVFGLLVLFLMAFGVFTKSSASAAAGTQVNVSINYLEETATVTAGPGGSTKFYISTDKMKSWEILDVSGVVDLSGILQTKSVSVYFKGNKDTNPREEVLQAAADNLKVSYKITDGAGGIIYTTTGSAIQYRKGNYGDWKTVTGFISTSIYEVKGAALQFRTAPSIATRAGKVYTVKVRKRPTAPAVKIDGSKLAVTGLKPKETQYRIGDSTIWIPFLPTDSKSKSLDLASLLGTTANTPISAATLEFRNLGSEKKLHSGVKIIELAAQRIVPNTISVIGSKLTITDGDKANSYEYTIVPKTTALNLSTAKWKSASTKSAMIIPKVSIGDKVLVRLKSKTESSTKQLILASTYKEFTIDSITVK